MSNQRYWCPSTFWFPRGSSLDPDL